jgi:hypothetical protein
MLAEQAGLKTRLYTPLYTSPGILWRADLQ